MMNSCLPLAMVGAGEVVTVVGVNAGRGLTKRLADMGLVPGTKLRIVNSQMSGPIMVEVRGSRLVLGRGVAQKVMVGEQG